jgi:hypothetical protein
MEGPVQETSFVKMILKPSAGRYGLPTFKKKRDCKRWPAKFNARCLLAITQYMLKFAAWLECAASFELCAAQTINKFEPHPRQRSILVQQPL